MPGSLTTPAVAAPALPAVFAISLAWPVLSPAHYERWRTPALSALRLILFSLPFHYGVEGQVRHRCQKGRGRRLGCTP